MIMVMKRNPAAQSSAQPAAHGQFEQDDGEQATATAEAAPAAEAQAAAAVGATTAIAKAAATSVAASSPRMVALLQDYKNAMPALDFGVLMRLTGSNGGIMDKDKAKLGEWIQIELVSWHDEWVISPGSDEADAREAVRYSADNKTIDGTGQPIGEYVEFLKNEGGYSNANVKHYNQLVGILRSSQKGGDLHVGSAVQISLSPGSRKTFEGYRFQESVKAKLGKRTAEGIEFLKITAEVKSNNGKDFTLLKVSAGDVPA